MKIFALLATLVSPIVALAINPSYLIHNRDIPVTESGINAFRDTAKIYNVQKGEYTPNGKQDRVWSKEKNSGYFLSVEYSSTAMLGMTEIYRKPEGSHTARKISMNRDGSIKSMTDCDATKGGALNSLNCMTATPEICTKVRAVFAGSPDLERSLMACDSASASLKKVKEIYDTEKVKPAFKKEFNDDTAALKKDFDMITNKLSWTDFVGSKEIKFNTNDDLTTLAMLCNGKIKAENGVWQSATRAGATGNTSSQQGQR